MLLCWLQNYWKLFTFPNIKLDRNEEYQLLYPTVELENLGMGKDYVSLTKIKSKSK